MMDEEDKVLLAINLHRTACLAQCKRMYPKKDADKSLVSNGWEGLSFEAKDNYLAMADYVLENYIPY